MPRNCAPKSTSQLFSRKTDAVSVTCAGCGKSFQLEARHQTGAAGSKIFCSEQCAQGQDPKERNITGFLSGLGPED